jgi:hypothetical protein
MLSQDSTVNTERKFLVSLSTYCTTILYNTSTSHDTHIVLHSFVFLTPSLIQSHHYTELLRRNPAGAVPVILKRLKQKDLEWRKARQQLTHQWKEILVKNADKSLDHRSFYFRSQDKRSYTTRFLVGDIKGEVFSHCTSRHHLIEHIHFARLM